MLVHDACRQSRRLPRPSLQFYNNGLRRPQNCVLSGPSWTKRSCRCRSSCPFAALRGQKEAAVAVLQLPFSAALRGPSWTKRSCRCRPAVAVLRAPSRPFVDKKKLPLPSCSCRSSCPFAALRGQKEVAVAVLQLPFSVPLRGPSWTKRSCRCRSAVAVLRAPSRPFVDKKKLPLPSCSCRSSCPFAALRGQKEVAVAVLPLPFFLPLRALCGQKEVAVAVLQLSFFVPLRGPSWTKGSCRCRPAVAVLRAPSRPFVDKMKLPLPFCSYRSPRPFVDKKKLPLPFCSCRSPCPFAALRGQKEVAVAVLQLSFFVPLRGPSWTKRSCRCRPAVAVLRAPSRPFVDKKKLPLPFCRCRSSCPFAALRGQKEVAVAILQLSFSAPLRGSKRCSPRPSADRPQLSTQTGYALVAT